MQRRFRLTRTNDFKRVRRFGRSYAHPLVVLVATRSDRPGVRIGVAAGKVLGKAVRRNRAKRLLREALRPLLTSISPGCDLILIARLPILQASLPEIRAALTALLKNAHLFEPLDESRVLSAQRLPK